MKKIVLIYFAWLSLITGAIAQNNLSLPGACGYNNENSLLPKNGSASLGQTYNNTSCGLNYVQSSVKITTRYSNTSNSPLGPGTGFPCPMPISGIPSCYVVDKAYLYWIVSYQSGSSTTPTVSLTNPSSVTNSYSGTLIGSDVSKCWTSLGEIATRAFRADITPAITGSGNGTYTINSIAGNTDWEIDGATLIIIYKDPSATWKGSLIIDDGIMTFAGGSFNHTISGFSACGAGSNSSAFMIASDLQDNVGPTFNATCNGTVGTFSKLFWNFAQVSTSVGSGQSSSFFNLDDYSDCFAICATGLYFQTTTCGSCSSGSLALSTSSTPANCSVCNGTVSVSASGGTSPYSYSWNTTPAQNSATATNLCAGTYTVTVTDASGCLMSTASATVTSTSATPVNVTPATSSICPGNSVNLTASGVVSYSWSPAAGLSATTGAAVNASPAATTTYTVTGTDGSGCTSMTTATVNIFPNPTINISASSNPICPGNCTTLTATGGSSYNWSNPPGGTVNPVVVCPASTTTYTVTGTDANGCTGTYSTVVTVNPLPTADAGLPQTICPGNSATLTASVGGTYAWNIGPLTQSITVNPAVTTTYTVTVTLNGCTASDNVTVTVSSGITADAGLPQTICNGQSATLTASGGSSYAWSNGGLTQIITVSPTVTTTYTVTASSGGCSDTDDVIVTVNPLPAADAGSFQTICSGASATLVASGGTTYQWSTGAGTQTIVVNPVITTTYTVTVSGGGCSNTDDVTVTAMIPPPIDAGPDASYCLGGSAQLNATGGLTYSWTPATGLSNTSISNPVANPSATTTYFVSSMVPVGNVIINGDFSSGYSGFTSGYTYQTDLQPEGTFYVGSNPQTYHPGFVACTDHTTGMGNMMIVNGSGTPNTDVFCQTISVSPNTDYDFSCWATSVSAAGSPAILQFSINGVLLGSAFTVSATTCTWNQFFATWNSGSNTSANICIVNQNTTLGGNDFALDDLTFSPLCTSSDSVVVTVYLIPVADAGPPQTICNGQSATFTATGGGSYLWSNGGGTQSITVSPTMTTTYSVTVNVAGCTGTDDVTLTVNPLPVANAGTDQIICNGQSANLTAFGGGTYLWSNFSTNQSTNVSPTTTTIYTVTVTSAVGCTATDDVQVTVNPLPPANAGADQSICFSNTTSLNASGGPSYAWSPSAGLSATDISNPTANPTTTTTYNLTVTDGNGCSASDYLVLTVNPLPVANAGPDQSICFGSSANLNASGGVLYYWSPSTGLNSTSISNPVASPTDTITYTVVVTDANGCTDDDDIIIYAPPLLTYTYMTDSVNCFSGSDGSIFIAPTGGTTPYVYTWNPSVSNGPMASNLSSGTYYVTITDHNGCDTTAIITVDQPPQIILNTSGNVTICMGQSTTISANASGGTGAYTFTWDNGLGNGNSFSVNPITTTTYTVSITDANGCTAPSQSLTVYVSPPINVSLSSVPPSICLGESSVLTATANGGNGNYIYNWSGGIGISTSTVTVSPLATTTYYVTVTDNCNSPQGVDSVTITVYPLPVVQFTSDTIDGCEPLVVNFTDFSTPAIGSWHWDFGDPNSGSNNTSALQNPSHFYENAGTYTVTLTVVTTNGCSGSCTHQNMIEVYPMPDAYFTYDPQTISIFDPNVNFIDMSNGASTWNWNFGDPATLSDNTSSEQSPLHNFSNPGTYHVILIITTQYGCMDSTSTNVTVNPEFTFYTPNAFSPDDNGKNDYFFPKGDGWDLNNYEFYVFDRWGEMIFNTNDVNVYWNGKKTGGSEVVQQGVYTWLVIVKDFASETHTFKGIVTVLRK